MKKTTKERKHHVCTGANPMPLLVPTGDCLPDAEQPIPPEYNGPIITDFLTWLNPYDALPTNKNGILLGNSKESLMVRRAITVVESNITLKSGTKKRKTSGISSRPHRGRRERNADCKRRIVPHSCCRPDDEQTAYQASKYRTVSASKKEKTNVDRSVGNKRCYIDPIEWERETASILRSTISVQNKVANRLEPVLPTRETKSSVVSTHGKSVEPLNRRKSFDDSDSMKLSAIGRSICKLQNDNKNQQKSISFSKSCSSIYTPYKVVGTPLKEEPTKSVLKRNNKK